MFDADKVVGCWMDEKLGLKLEGGRPEGLGWNNPASHIVGLKQDCALFCGKIGLGRYLVDDGEVEDGDVTMGSLELTTRSRCRCGCGCG